MIMKQYNIFRIKEVATEKGFKCKQLAEALGVSPQYVSHLFHGRGVGIGMLMKVAKVLGVGVRDLIVRTESDKGTLDECKRMLADYVCLGKSDTMAVVRMIVTIWRVASPQERADVIRQFVMPLLPADFDYPLCRAYLSQEEAGVFMLDVCPCAAASSPCR